MKKIIYLVLITILATSCSEQGVKVIVKNTCDFDRSESLVEISLNQLNEKLSLKADQVYIIISANGDTLASQQTYDNKLIFQSGLAANQSSEFSIVVGQSRKYETKVHGQVQPKRKSDFHWENDRVGFRYYNAELKQFEAPSNGLDLWYKRTNKIVVAEWYEKELGKIASYHQDHGEGCDPYTVGRTLGAGSVAPFINGNLVLNENYETAEIFDNGPLRVTFKLTYPDLEIDGEQVSESKIISLDAGSQLTKIEQSFGNKTEMTAAVGIVKRDSDKDAILYHKGADYFVYQEPETPQLGQIFLGVIIPQGIDRVFVNSYNYTNPINNREFSLANTLATTQVVPNKVLTYYTGFGWSKFGFTNAEIFETYLKQYSEELRTPFVIQF